MGSKHFNAKDDDYASTVLMPGDPLRAQYIAERHLKNARRVNDVRAMYGFTGEYRGRPISVQAHGIGIPSASLYCHELLAEFRVKSTDCCALAVTPRSESTTPFLTPGESPRT